MQHCCPLRGHQLCLPAASRCLARMAAPHRPWMRPTHCAAPLIQRHTLVAATMRDRNTSVARFRRADSTPAAIAAAGLLLLSPLLFAAAAQAQVQQQKPLTVLEGSARVVDGDTLYVGGEKVRLFAVDAPEKGQSCSRADGRPYACGEASASALSEHLKGGTVRCEVRSRDQYGRNVAACKLVGAASPAPVRQQQQQSTSSNDIGNWLVSNGLAVAYKQFGKDYVASEQVAAAQRRGIWQGAFTEPSLWRKQQQAASLGSVAQLQSPSQQQQQQQQRLLPGTTAARATTTAVASGAGACRGSTTAAIKGNINTRGERIYHTPSSASYAGVQVDERKGERWFCSEDEARSAGWRPAGRRR